LGHSTLATTSIATSVSVATLTLAGGANAKFTQPVTTTSAVNATSAQVQFASTVGGVGSQLNLVGSSMTTLAGWAFSATSAVTLSSSSLVMTTTSMAPLGSLSLTSGSTLTHVASTSSNVSYLQLAVTSDVFIDSTSSIDVSERGLLGGWRGDNFSQWSRVTGNLPSQPTPAAGSHIGAPYSGGYLRGDSVESPAFPGEGGTGGATSASPGGTGGGVVFLTASNAIVDGVIRANGGSPAKADACGGAGGTVSVRLSGTLTGAGHFEALGGNGLAVDPTFGFDVVTSSAGGGAILISAANASGFDVARSSAAGGLNAGTGSIVLFDGLTSRLVFNGPPNAYGFSLASSPRTWSSVVVRNAQVIYTGPLSAMTLEGGDGALLADGISLFASAVAWSNFTVYGSKLSAPNLSSLVAFNDTINVGVLDLPQAALQLTSSRWGSITSLSALSVQLTGSSLRTVESATLSAASISIDAYSFVEALRSTTGVGAAFNGGPAVGGSLVAGSAMSPVLPVSGRDGRSGGLLTINSPSLVVDGFIDASGLTYGQFPGLGGAGGSLIINASTLSGAGTINAYGNGGGGGGRIVVTTDGAVGPTLSAAAFGGGGVGTVLVTTAGVIALTLDNSVDVTTTQTPVDLALVDSLTVTGARVRFLSDLTVTGALAVSASTIAAPSLSLNTQTALTLTDSTVSLDGTVNGQVDLGLGTTPLSLLLTRSKLSLGTLNRQFDTVALVGSTLSQSPGTIGLFYIGANSLTVSADSAIDVSGAGGQGGWTTSNQNPWGLTDTGGQVLNRAGSYGGPGVGSPFGVTEYGDLTYGEPGSGGAGDATGSQPGGNGGGYLMISAQTLLVDGVLRANGANGFFGGSGGGIEVYYGLLPLTGVGRIEALGGNGGGGGRIVIDDLSGFLGSVDASRVVNGGGPGTVYVSSTNELFVDAKNVQTNLTVPPTNLPGTDLYFSILHVLGGAHVQTAANVTADVTDVDATSTFSSPNLTLP
jgi:hypothetical protein